MLRRLEKLERRMIYPMHGSVIDGSVFPRYASALNEYEFAYSGILLGKEISDKTIM
jgi:hypothetical protein